MRLFAAANWTPQRRKRCSPKIGSRRIRDITKKADSLPAHTLCDSVSQQAMGIIRGSGQSLRQPSLIRSQGMIVLDTSVRQSSRPFRVAVPQATIDRILNRVREAQFQPTRRERLAVRNRLGLHEGARRDWANEYDWRKAETDLNRYPQFVARVDDYDIHFYHVKGRGPKPMPLVLTHGWPENRARLI